MLILSETSELVNEKSVTQLYLKGPISDIHTVNLKNLPKMKREAQTQKAI